MQNRIPVLPKRSKEAKPLKFPQPIVVLTSEPVQKKPRLRQELETEKKSKVVGKRATKRQRENCWRYLAGNEREIECPCCFKTKLIYSASRSWEASHILPKAHGGTAEAYNLYPLCVNCNGNMSDMNMFCYFADQPQALRLLIETMHNMFRIEFPRMYRKCNEQFYQLAQHYYAGSETGCIPRDHPTLWEQFMAYDITQNTKRVLAAKEVYDKAKEIAEKTHVEYERLFLK
jgi:hypothetical protein